MLSVFNGIRKVCNVHPVFAFVRLQLYKLVQLQRLLRCASMQNVNHLSDYLQHYAVHMVLVLVTEYVLRITTN